MLVLLHLVFLKKKLIADEFSSHLGERCLLMDNTNIAEDRDVKVGWETDNSSLWEIFEPVSQLMLTVKVTVIVWAMRLLTIFSMKTLFDFEILRMELLFFPAMTVWALVF